MKSVFCQVLAAPKDGDELRICYTHKARGGMTEAAIKIGRDHFWRQLKEGEQAGKREVWNFQPDPNVPVTVFVAMTESETCTAIAASLADIITRLWTGEMFSCKARNNELVITTSDDDVIFFPMLNGTKEAGLDVVTVE
jgi:hypothetical protein